MKTALIDPDNSNYYRGFVTIDVVTADTTLSPVEAGYPLGTANALEGWIYYVRIAEGSSNGLAMVPLQEVGTGVDSALRGLYSGSDGREEIDIEARACAAALATGGACVSQSTINRIRSRVFLNPTFNASSRIIVFLWNPFHVGEALSPYCDTHSCGSTYTWAHYDDSGTNVDTHAFRLDHVVNVFDVSGTDTGFVSMHDIDVGSGMNWQVYAFSTNSAKPSGASQKLGRDF